MSVEKPLAKLIHAQPLWLYGDHLEYLHDGWHWGLRRPRRSIPLKGLNVKVQAMGGGMGHITLRKQEATLTIYGSGVALTRTATGAGVKRLMQFEAAMLGAISALNEPAA